MKRLITLQDISCVGRCSITVALPIISAMGVECGILPTAVLSTHTMFKNFTCKDISDQIEPISKAWKKEGIEFDGIYTGYLASKAQCMQVCSFFDEFKTEKNLILVDPAMADHGKLYAAFDKEFPSAMANVCKKADIIVPNITEACLMTGVEYREEHDEKYISNLLDKLLELGCSIAIITGVSYNKNEIGVVYRSKDGEDFLYSTRRCVATYHGTGDLFASTLVGGIMRGFSLQKAIKLAADFVVICIDATTNSENSSWYGVEFEMQIPKLCNMMHDDMLHV